MAETRPLGSVRILKHSPPLLRRRIFSEVIYAPNHETEGLENQTIMLSEKDYFQRIQSLIPNEGEIPSEVLELLEKALVDYPDDAEFWHWRGDLIQMSSDDGKYELEDALKSYERALEIDPLCAEAYESIGYYNDVIMGNQVSAESPFRKAIELGAGKDSYYGLARVLAELDRATEALEIISPENCPYHEAEEIQELKTEIEEGFWYDDSV